MSSNLYQQTVISGCKERVWKRIAVLQQICLLITGYHVLIKLTNFILKVYLYIFLFHLNFNNFIKLWGFSWRIKLLYLFYIYLLFIILFKDHSSFGNNSMQSIDSMHVQKVQKMYRLHKWVWAQQPFIDDVEETGKRVFFWFKNSNKL